METEKLPITQGAWVTVLADGGTCIIQGATTAIRVRITQAANPAIDADALDYEEFQTRDGLNFNNIPEGTKLLIAAQSGDGAVKVVR
ncbi:hypothetical protein [Thalassobius sp. I31.1]|uniref:hypothetical protein n=1 Tax=Thalassobius sp. I31.1 TaxID=2109912 RepID=UPI000D19EF25|nr:hypothetical protein [Thalassobius sp. I31.1]